MLINLSNFAKEKLTRRNFLKSSSLILLTLGAFPLNSCTKQKFAFGIIVADEKLCGGCRRCEIVCSLSKHPFRVRTESALLKLDRLRFEHMFNNFSPNWKPDTCQQCLPKNGTTPCVEVCPTGACHIEQKTGAIIISHDVCIGCGSCITECPYRMNIIDNLFLTENAPEGRASKCNLCSGKPACVQECPAGALKFHLA